MEVRGFEKIKVTVPEDVWDIIKIGQEDFGINNNKFCNYILEKLKFNEKLKQKNYFKPKEEPIKDYSIY